MIETKQPSGQLKVVPLTDDENLFEQLTASLERITEGVNHIGAAVDVLAAKPSRCAELRIDGPEPMWVRELRVKYENAVECRSSVCVVTRESIANVLTLIDLSRKQR